MLVMYAPEQEESEILQSCSVSQLQIQEVCHCSLTSGRPNLCIVRTQQPNQTFGNSAELSSLWKLLCLLFVRKFGRTSAEPKVWPITNWLCVCYLKREQFNENGSLLGNSETLVNYYKNNSVNTVYLDESLARDVMVMIFMWYCCKDINFSALISWANHTSMSHN